MNDRKGSLFWVYDTVNPDWAAAGALVLATAPERASYASDLLPGLVVIGLGVGLVFPGASITAFSIIDPTSWVSRRA